MTIEDVFRKLKAALNELQNIPISETPTDDELNKFALQLKTIYVNAFVALDYEDSTAFIQQATIFLNEQSNSEPFFYLLHTAQSKKTQDLPQDVFQSFARKTTQLNISNLFHNPKHFFENTFYFLNSNSQFQAKSEIEEDMIENYNLSVFRFHFKYLHFDFIENVLNFQSTTSTGVIYMLYRMCLMLLMFVSFIALAIATLLFFGAVSVLSALNDFMFSSLVVTIRNAIERPILNFLTNNQYDDDIEHAAYLSIGKAYREEEHAFVRLDTGTNGLQSDEELRDLGLRVMNIRANQILQKPNNGLPNDLNQIKLNMNRNVVQARGANHLRFAIDSLFGSLMQSIPVEQNKLIVLSKRLLSLCVAIPIILGLTLPLVLLNVIQSIIDFVCLAAIILVASLDIGIMAALFFLDSLPGYLYESLFSNNQIRVVPTNEEKERSVNKFCRFNAKGFSMFHKLSAINAGEMDDLSYIPKFS